MCALTDLCVPTRALFMSKRGRCHAVSQEHGLRGGHRVRCWEWAGGAPVRLRGAAEGAPTGVQLGGGGGRGASGARGLRRDRCRRCEGAVGGAHAPPAARVGGRDVPGPREKQAEHVRGGMQATALCFGHVQREGEHACAARCPSQSRWCPWKVPHWTEGRPLPRLAGRLGSRALYLGTSVCPRPPCVGGVFVSKAHWGPGEPSLLEGLGGVEHDCVGLRALVSRPPPSCTTCGFH